MNRRVAIYPLISINRLRVTLIVINLVLVIAGKTTPIQEQHTNQTNWNKSYSVSSQYKYTSGWEN